jgi:hypothetical protein
VTYVKRGPKRHGTSHAGDGIGAYPRVCAYGERCLYGGKIRVTAEGAAGSIQFLTDPHRGVRWSWHVDCRRMFGPPAGVFGES